MLRDPHASAGSAERKNINDFQIPSVRSEHRRRDSDGVSQHPAKHSTRQITLSFYSLTQDAE
jgi:hypothetical protein